jgi:UDP-N-acetyl-D-mannosaminuronic acid dehydrogenase
MTFTIEDNISQHLILENSTLDELLQILNKKLSRNFGSGIAFVTDSSNQLKGIIEDSDLRKYLSKNDNSSIDIKNVMQKDFISVPAGLNEKETISIIVAQLKKRGFLTTYPVQIIPVLNFGVMIGFIDLQKIALLIEQNTQRHIVVGLGYVGLTLALSISKTGSIVFGFDEDNKKINQLLAREIYISEPGLESLLNEHLNTNFLPISTLENLENNSHIQRVYYICIGTPLLRNQNPDLSQINNFIDDLVEKLNEGDILIMRSTVPVGTGRQIINKIEDSRNWKVGLNFYYISAPERTVEGNALIEIRELPQLVAGASENCLLLGLKTFSRIANSVTSLDQIESVELIKLMGNSFRDYVFGFSNYFIQICQSYNLDLNSLIESSNRGYPRSGIPLPSPGVGGPCLTKDSYFLNNILSKLSTENGGGGELASPIIAARNVNRNVPKHSVKFIEEKVSNLPNFDFLGIGVAFKGIPETNDYRNSTSIEFIDELKGKVKSISVWDSVIEVTKTSLSFKPHKKSNRYNFVAILNNHPKNIEFFHELSFDVGNNTLIIYDPWRLLNEQLHSLESPVKKIMYFSLSHCVEINKES